MPKIEIYSRAICDLVSAVVFIGIIIMVSAVWLQ